MWADNFQRVNDNYQSILTPTTASIMASTTTKEKSANNGRINLLTNTEQMVKNRINLFERTQPVNKATDYRNPTSTILQDTKLSTMYFSAKNIQYIQDTLKEAVYERSNHQYRLLPQNEDDLKIIMRGYYLQYVENDIGNEAAEMKRINGLVLAFLIPRLLNESEGYAKYIRDQSTLVMPFDRAVQVDRDYKELEYQPFFNNWSN